MFLNDRVVNYFYLKFNKVKRHFTSRNLEKKLDQQYTEIMRNKKSVLSDKTYN